MIRLLDGLTLASTKLRTRRIRTGITVLLSGLLFGALIGSLLMMRGAVDSIQSFNQDGLGGKYILMSYPNMNDSNIFNEKSIVDRAQAIYKKTVADKTREAKRLGVAYQESSEPKATIDSFDGSPMLNFRSPSATAAIAEYRKSHPFAGLPELKQDAAPYNPINYYSSELKSPTDGSMVAMENGKEVFEVDPKKNQNQQEDPAAKDPVAYGFQVMDDTLTTPFMLPDADVSVQPDVLPIIIEYSYVEQFLGLKKLPKDASAQAKLERIRDVRTRAHTVTFSSCYRNQASKSQIDGAIATADEIKKNAAVKDYVKPSLIYGLPANDGCGPAVVTADTRTATEKSLAAKQNEFEKLFGGFPDPVQKKITYKVVGVSADSLRAELPTGIDGLIKGLVGSSLGGAVVPKNLYQKTTNFADYQKIFGDGQMSPFGDVTTVNYVELASANDAKTFIEKRSCDNGTCSPGREFTLQQFGNASIVLEDLQSKFNQLFQYAVLIVALAAMIIMSGTIGRMIADGRRETAVFRAIGAKRTDIISIYAIYTILLSIVIAVFAIGMGIAIAVGVNIYFAGDVTAQAQLAYGLINESRQFSFIGIDVIPLIAVVGLVLAVGIIGMILPMIRNVRRNPINDMRDE